MLSLIVFFGWKKLTLHLCGLFQVKYKEKYEREKGKPMLDFETPTYVTAKEAQHMQSQVNPPVPSPLGFKWLQTPIKGSLFSACYKLTCIVMPLLYIDML